MSQRVIRTEADKATLIKFIEGHDMPCTVSVTKGAKRSTEQNRLQRLWINEIAEQLGDQTPEQVRAYCKLTIGVPILREENDDFREQYDRVFKPLQYELKIELMMEPFDFPVTRLMKTKQKKRYLDNMGQHFAEKGFSLTNPDDLSWAGSIAA